MITSTIDPQLADEMAHKCASLAVRAFAAESCLREQEGEDFSKSASESEPEAKFYPAASEFAKKAGIMDVLDGIFGNKARHDAIHKARIGGGAVGGLGGYGIGNNLGKDLARSVLSAPDMESSEAEREKYRNRVQLAGLLGGIPGAVGGYALGSGIGEELGGQDDINEFIQGIDRESIGNFIDKITPTVSWD